MSMHNCYRLVFAACLYLMTAAAGQADLPAHDGDRQVWDVAELIDQVERARRLHSNSAVLLQESLLRTDVPQAELELALLEIFGPAPVFAPDRGLERLRALNAEGSEYFSHEARVFLRLVQDHLVRLQTELATRNALEIQLQAEREAHLETLKKLEALRRIEQQLEPSQPDVADDNGESSS